MRDYTSNRVFNGIRYLTKSEAVAHRKRLLTALEKRATRESKEGEAHDIR